MNLRPEFISLLEEDYGVHTAHTVIDALDKEPSTSIRLNPSKIRECPFPGASAIPWSPYGYILSQRPSFTLDPLFHAGCYYVQESSAMMAGQVFRSIPFSPGAAVLDLCAAPGGKTTDLAASLRESLGENFSLLANEVMKNRFGILRDNIQTWGDSRTGVVSRDPSAFGKEPLFDIILADVPCSGEGMFRKDPEALRQWNPELPDFCAARARRIISDIWPTLRCGGFLLFSTCTFNRKENDDNVRWICSELGGRVIPPEGFSPATATECGIAMLPGLVPGEGQWIALIEKTSGESGSRAGDILRLFGADIPIPAEGPLCDVSREDAIKYLHGDAIKLGADAPVGPVVISYEGHALGPAKNIGPRCNNLYPKSKRIRKI